MEDFQGRGGRCFYFQEPLDWRRRLLRIGGDRYFCVAHL